MRPWDTFSAREADELDYDGLADALKPDRDLLDHHYWRDDFKRLFGADLNDEELDRHAELASAVLGRHPDSTIAQQIVGEFERQGTPDFHTQPAIADQPPHLGVFSAEVPGVDRSGPSAFVDVGHRPSIYGRRIVLDSESQHPPSVTQAARAISLLPTAGLDSFPQPTGLMASGPLPEDLQKGGPFQREFDAGLGAGLTSSAPYTSFEDIAVAGVGGPRGKKSSAAPPPKRSDDDPPIGRNHNLPPGMSPLPPEEPPQIVIPPAAESARKRHSKILRANMKKAGIEELEGAAAHHIVASADPRAAPARKVLEDFGIDFNDADNGVFLPARKDSPNPFNAAVHASLHNDTYYQKVNDMLANAKSKQDVLWILNSIRADLQNNEFQK